MEAITFDEQRIERLAITVAASTDWVKEMLFTYDWPNQDEHENWLKTATDSEITDWLFGLFEGGK